MGFLCENQRAVLYAGQHMVQDAVGDASDTCSKPQRGLSTGSGDKSQLGVIQDVFKSYTSK